jgi:transposase-like protein
MNLDAMRTCPRCAGDEDVRVLNVSEQRMQFKCEKCRIVYSVPLQQPRPQFEPRAEV